MTRPCELGPHSHKDRLERFIASRTGIVTSLDVSKEFIRQARMAGMLDAFNIIREKLVKGEFDRTGGEY